jgi:L-amino acid N-acyltransferase YncA
VMTKEEAEALLVEAVATKRLGEKLYREAIKACTKARVSNTKMGAIAGQTEGAIRMYRKRKGL